MLILGIESTCDETGAAILQITEEKKSIIKIKILSNIINSQIAKHKEFGGVVPQLAAKLHQENMAPVLEKAFRAAKIKQEKIDVITVASGPGLIPALLVGVSAAKTLAWGLGKPLIGVNHMEGHIMAAMLPMSNVRCQMSKPKLPALALLVSGGHTQLVLMKKWLAYEIIGETRDDAAGEAFDKVAKMLGLGYPGGAKIEELASKGDPQAFNFPRPMLKSDDYDFSFSGLKTAVKNTIESLELKFKASCGEPLNDTRGKQRRTMLSVRPEYVRNIAASFQAAAVDVLVYKTIRAAKEYNIKTLIVGGGVSANQALCGELKKLLKENLPKAKFLIPKKQYANDNAAMIALAGYFRYKAAPRLCSGQTSKFGDWEDVQADAELRLNEKLKTKNEKRQIKI